MPSRLRAPQRVVVSGAWGRQGGRTTRFGVEDLGTDEADFDAVKFNVNFAIVGN